MFVKQCKDSFIRTFGEFGYITNQLTKKDMVFDRSGSIFLSTLSRDPLPIQEITRRIGTCFGEVSLEQLQSDVIEFINELEGEGFIVKGESVAETYLKDKGFTYQSEKPKTMGLRILNQDINSSNRPSDEILTDYFREHPTIFGVHFEVTSACNENCVHCYQTHHTPHHITMDMYKNILSQLDELGTVSITFSGGEPFLHPEFAKILQLSRRNDLMINILSNGTLIDEKYVELLKEININMIQISIYSMQPEIHDSITQRPDSLEKTLCSIERLLNNDVPVQISCPIMIENSDSYRDVATWCYDRHIRVMSDFVLMAKSNFDTSNLQHRLDLAKTERIIQDIIETDGEYQLLLDGAPKTQNLDHFAEQSVCGVAIDNVCFTSDGSMYPCSGFQGYLLGNVKKNSIREIWEHSPEVVRLRSIRNKSFPKCLQCDARDYCIMCLVRNFNESNGDMFKVAEHFCKVAFANKAIVEQFYRERIGS